MKCNCCFSNTIDTIYYDQFLNNKLQLCTNCGHIQVKESPSESDIYNYYNGKYSENRKLFIGSDYFNIMKKRAEAQFKIINKIGFNNLNKIIDLGCGYGLFLNLMKEKGINAYGIEFDKTAKSFSLSIHV